MKSLPAVLAALLLSAPLAIAHDMSTAAPPSEAQKSFTALKTLAGTWLGQLTLDPPDTGFHDQYTRVTMRVTSRGNALVHEMKEAGTPDDPKKYDDPITMLYVDGDRLLLVHYCDAGNRPRMAAKTSVDGKTVDFDFVDVSGSTQFGHMHHAIFSILDKNRHTEDWTYMMPGDKPMHAHLELHRVD
jgi:hypothetical protein